MYAEQDVFLSKVDAFAKAAQDLLEHWGELGDEVNANYPFAHSFDDVVSAIYEWKQTLHDAADQRATRPTYTIEDLNKRIDSLQFAKRTNCSRAVLLSLERGVWVYAKRAHDRVMQVAAELEAS